LSIPYYAIVSFDGFKDFVDEIGGLKIDVPERLIDNQFPDVNLKGFDPLIVEP
jgi:anionic cell wall polymer biosynthesis LytR-Cps2A-Psr (LCP) family protein